MKKRLLSLIPILAALAIAGCNNVEPTPTPSSGETSTTATTSSVPGSTTQSSTTDGQSTTTSGETPTTTTDTTQQLTLQSITFEGTYQTSFVLNEIFTHEGLQVRAHYNDPSSDRLVTNYTLHEPDMAVLGNQNVVVDYTENDVTVHNSYQITIVESGPSQADRQAAKQEVLEAFNDLDIDEYSSTRWNKIVAKLNSALAGIDAASTLEQITQIKNEAIEFFVNSPTASEIVAGTWFDEHSAESNYEFDRDDNNKLVITYDGYPGHWVYIGTRTNLITNVTENNVLSLKFTNDISEEIGVCLQATDDSGEYKLDTGVVKVSGNSEKVLELRYDIDICKLYFFLDCVGEAHTRKGQITIQETKLYFEDRTPTEYYSPKTISMDYATVEKGDEGVNTKYYLQEEDHPLFIDRVDVAIRVDYHGNSDGGKYFGVVVYTGSEHTRLGESEGHTSNEKKDDVETGKANVLFNVPISSAKKLTTGNEIRVEISYAAGPTEDHPTFADLTFEVVSYRFHYTLWRTETSEIVNVNQKIYENGAATETVSIPYSSFTKTGRVNRMKINFTTLNMFTYGKSQIYFNNFGFTEFSSGNNNVLNIGKIMDTTQSGEPTQGSWILYPLNDIDLSEEGVSITIDCWWASATDITVDSIEMFTDDISAPEAPTTFVAHPLDGGMVIEWSKVNNASTYEVYKDGVVVDEVKRTSYKFTGLTNNTEYTFGVIAKNYAGESEMVTVKGTPVEGAEYDDLIQGLNTDLEELIGLEGIDAMFDASLTYLSKANNERFKSKLEAMQSGTATKIAFMGGSITVGETSKLKDERGHAKGYAYHTYQWLRNNYDKNDNSEFINGSISGTGSENGIVRVKKDILDHNPDIIFLEFAANNGSSAFYKQTYESLIRKFLALPSNPAVVLVFSATYYSGSSEDYMAAIGEHYHLPMFTLDKALKEVCTIKDEYGHLTREDPIYHDFSDDGTHPNDNGHVLYAKCLANFCKQLDMKTKDSEVGPITSPSQVGYDKYENLVSFDNTNSTGVVTSLGSFVATDTSTPSTSQQSDVTAYQHGWKKTTTDANEAMVIEVNAKNFVLIYEAGNPSVENDPTGNIVVTYTNKNDASDTSTIIWDVSKTNQQDNMNDLTEIKAKGNGWQNPVSMLIFDKNTAGDYTITIQMETVEGIATIMAFGYTA